MARTSASRSDATEQIKELRERLDAFRHRCWERFSQKVKERLPDVCRGRISGDERWALAALMVAKQKFVDPPRTSLTFRVHGKNIIDRIETKAEP